MEDFPVVSTSMSSSKFIRLVMFLLLYVYSEAYWVLGFENVRFLAGDLSLMPEVSVDLVCNLMEGTQLIFVSNYLFSIR